MTTKNQSAEYIPNYVPQKTGCLNVEIRKEYITPTIECLSQASIETGNLSNQPENTSGIWALGS